MHIQAKAQASLRRILWIDASLGGSSAVLGLLVATPAAQLTGLSAELLLVIAVVTLLYAVGAGLLVSRRVLPLRWVKVLVVANWLWTAISVGLMIATFRTATAWGVAYLALNVFAVGGLAYLEGRQLGQLTNFAPEGSNQ